MIMPVISSAGTAPANCREMAQKAAHQSSGACSWKPSRIMVVSSAERERTASPASLTNVPFMAVVPASNAAMYAIQGPSFTRRPRGPPAGR